MMKQRTLQAFNLIHSIKKGMFSVLGKGILTPWLRACLRTEFDLTFKKRFVSFSNRNNSQSDPKCCPPCLGDEENFSL